jgi:hypothetical protein
MGAAWYNTKTECTFKYRTTSITSSTILESLAILLALEITPSNRLVNIHTNSQSTIFRLKSIMSGDYKNIFISHILKISNWQIWEAICHTIYLKNLIIMVTKVEVHSDNFFNNTANTLAKEDCDLQNPVFVYNNSAASRISFTLTNRSIIVERNTRKFLKYITQNIHRGL